MLRLSRVLRNLCGMERTSTQRILRACAGALALGISLSGLILTSTAAHAATTTATYVSDEDSVTTSSVTAIVIDETTDYLFDANQDPSLGSDWYYCDAAFDTTNFVTVTGTLNVILGDNCDWKVDALQVATGSTLTVWSAPQNTGKLEANASSGPGIRVYDTSSLTLNGGTVTAVGAVASAGIGAGPNNSNGPITIQWRSNVYAKGGDAVSGFGAGAGIGGGGSNTNATYWSLDNIINTSGLVIAKGGSASGSFTAGADIGSGGCNGFAAYQTHSTTTVAAPVVATGGTAKMFDTKLNLVTPTALSNVALGSSVTYLAQPNAGYQVDYVGYSGGTITGLGNNAYRFTPTQTSPPIGASISFAIIPTTLSLTVAPASVQTYPGNVTLSSTFTDNGDPIENIPVVFTVNGTPQTAVNTNSEGVATLTLTSPAPGTFSFGASFAGDELHAGATATPLTGYVVLATQPDFTISSPAATDTVYGHAPFTLATTGQLSEGIVKWSVPANNGIVSIDPTTGTVSILAAGTVTVTATAPADASHAAATVTRSVTISPRPVTVRPDPQSVQFGDEFTLTWTATPALVEGDSLTGSLQLADPIQIGDNTIVEAMPFANPNYTVHFEPGTLTVTANDAQQNVIDEIELLPTPIITQGQADSVAIASVALAALSEDERAALPQSVLDRIETAQGEAGIMNHRDEAAGVTASGTALPWNVRLVVRAASAQETTAFTAQLASGRELLALNDIHFVKTLTNSTWQPPLGASVEISLSKVQLDDFTDTRVHHQLVSGSLEAIPSTRNGRIVSFDGNSFSIYGVSGVPAAALPNTGSDGVTAGMRLAGLATLLAGAGAFVVVATRKRAARR